jgi:hypothetical protein
MNDFSMDFVSEEKHKNLAIDIYYKKQRLCQIHNEFGNDFMIIEFLTDLYILKEIIKMSFPLTDFINILNEARDNLAETTMTNEPVDKYSGITMSEWINRVPNELEMDAVGLWQIIPTGRDSFQLTGKALDEFAKRSIIALIDRGAVPVLPSSTGQGHWKQQDQYGSSSTEIADKILNEWRQSGRDPDHDGLWFSLQPD